VHLGFSPGEARDKSVVKWSSAQARSRRCCRQIQASVQAPTSTHLIRCARLTLIGKSKLGETVVVAGGEWPGRLAFGQLAKMAGARAVGIAGGGEKCPMWRRKSVSMRPLITARRTSRTGSLPRAPMGDRSLF
jgi:NADPH-dependent curcumin reductase CurA